MMMTMTIKTIKVANHWFNDSGDVEIVLLESLIDRELINNLFWYSGDERPLWVRGTTLSDDEVMATHPYKQRKMQSIDDDIPNDCYMSLT
ncbi:hypothetical protein [Lacticaseibacillus sp. N501-2]|uniref:hypothetical protein n=1 Tax=Lacticaseibacillus salsurae TaxID=3367729 RepID=UPI0038B26E97